MADPATISVVFNAPILVQILEALKALGTQLEVVSTRLQALEVRLTVAPTADGASSIEFDDRLMPANDDDDQVRVLRVHPPSNGLPSQQDCLSLALGQCYPGRC